MPYKSDPIPELTTFAEAKSLVAKLTALGVPVGTIFEVSLTDRYDTTDPRYFDDKGQHQYIAKIWGGPEQELAMVKTALGAGGYNAFLRLAEQATATTAQAEAAIINLPPVFAAVDAVLVI